MKNSLIPKYLYCILYSLALTSCRSKIILPSAPINEAAEYPELPQTDLSSIIQIPVSIPLNLISQRINSEIPSDYTFYNEVNCPEIPTQGQEYDCRISGNISIGKIELKGKGNKLTATNSIGGTITFLWCNRWDVVLGSHHECHDKNLHFGGNVTLSASPFVETNWNITPHLSSNLDLTEAYIHVGPKISLRTVIEDKVNPKLAEKIAAIEEQFKSKINIKEKLLPFWSKLSKPILLNADSNIWVTMKPMIIYYNNMDIVNDTIKMDLALKFEARTYFGPKPEPLQLNDIPNLSAIDTRDNLFNIHIPVIINYAELTNLAKAKIPDTTYILDDKVSLHVSDVEIMGDTRNVFIKLSFDAKNKLTKAKGVLFLKGSPVMDSAKQILSINNLDFDLSTKNILLNAADWLLHPQLLNKIQALANFDLNPKILSGIQRVNSKLNNLLIQDQINVSANIDQFTINQIILSQNGIIIITNTKGHSKASVLKI
ncbi:MAG TPA: DUF4403 family protein [Saprospiraceae bacterium]|nr:DUF4403 family protein [Saprospiraceae bacterium]